MKNRNTKILLVNQSVGYLMVDIANAYAQKYAKVILMEGSHEELERKLNPNIITQRIIKYSRKSILMRCMTWGIATLQIFFLIIWKYRKYKIVFVTNPPTSYFAALILRLNYSIIVYDVYPDALCNIGITPNNVLYKLWASINRKIYSNAQNIYTLSSGMAQLLAQYCNSSNIQIIPNWSGIDVLSKVLKKDNPFVCQHKLDNKFVIMYSGNIGYTHNVESIIELAKVFRSNMDICFYIIGEGLKKNELIKKVNDENLSNCSFLPWQSADNLKYSLSAANLAIVTLTDDTALASVPSKTYNLLTMGTPLLCISPLNSELAHLIKKNNCGKCFIKDDLYGMTNFVETLFKDQIYYQMLSANSLKASQKFQYSNSEKYVS